MQNVENDDTEKKLIIEVFIERNENLWHKILATSMKHNL